VVPQVGCHVCRGVPSDTLAEESGDATAPVSTVCSEAFLCSEMRRAAIDEARRKFFASLSAGDDTRCKTASVKDAAKTSQGQQFADPARDRLQLTHSVSLAFDCCVCASGLQCFDAVGWAAGRASGPLKNMGGWWRWSLVSPDGVGPRRMVGVSASVNLPMHHKVQKFSSGTGSTGWSRKRAVKRLWCGGGVCFH